MCLKNYLQGKIIKTQISELFGIILDIEKDNFTLTILKPKRNINSKRISEFIILYQEFQKGKYMEIKLLGYKNPFLIDFI